MMVLFKKGDSMIHVRSFQINMSMSLADQPEAINQSVNLSDVRPNSAAERSKRKCCHHVDGLCQLQICTILTKFTQVMTFRLPKLLLANAVARKVEDEKKKAPPPPADKKPRPRSKPRAAGKLEKQLKEKASWPSDFLLQNPGAKKCFNRFVI